MDNIAAGYTCHKAEDVPRASHLSYHFHPNDELLIVHSGDVIAMTPNTYLSHKGPCMIFYKKMCPHTQINLQTTDYERYCISFERNSIMEFMEDLSLFRNMCRNDAYLLPLDSEEDREIFAAASLLYGCKESGCSEMKKKLILSYILTCLTDAAAKSGPAKPSSFYLTHVARYIALHIKEKLTIGGIAESFGISRTKLIRDFKEFFSMSVQDYICMERLVRAKEYLRRGESVSAAAEECGFIDSAYFIKVFRSHMGITPAQYRKECADAPDSREIPQKITNI